MTLINTKTSIKINTLKINGIDLDITYVSQLDIYEDLEQLGPSGTLVYQDWNFLENFGEISLGDKLEISFTRFQPGGEDYWEIPIEYTFRLTNIKKENKFNNLHNLLAFEFETDWVIEANIRRRSRYWTNARIDQIIKDLVKECGGNVESNDIGNSEFIPTKQKLERFVSPYWTPIETIYYLLKISQDENGNGNYHLWTDLQTGLVQFWPIARLLKKEYYSIVNDSNIGTVPFDLSMNTPSEFSARKILGKIAIEDNADLIRDSSMGVIRNKHVGFDYDNTRIISKEKRIDSIETSLPEKKLPFSSHLLGLQYRPTYYSGLFENRTELNKGDTASLIDGYSETRMSTFKNQMLKLRLKVNGEGTFKRVGKNIKVVYPSIDASETTETEDKQYTGNYLITKIRHFIQGTEYVNVLSLVSYGYNEREIINIDTKGITNFNLISSNKEMTYGGAYDGDKYDIGSSVLRQSQIEQAEELDAYEATTGTVQDY